MGRGKKGILGLLALFWLLTGASEAGAHKMLVSAVAGADGGLQVQVFFPDGNPAQEVPVSVIPGDGRPPLTGKTDGQGAASFAALAPGPYRVEAGDPLGHRAEARVVIPGAGAPAPASGAASPASPAAAPALPPRGEPIPWGNILAGLGFIFGLTALLMVLRLRAEVRRHAPRD